MFKKSGARKKAADAFEEKAKFNIKKHTPLFVRAGKSKPKSGSLSLSALNAIGLAVSEYRIVCPVWCYTRLL